MIIMSSITTAHPKAPKIKKLVCVCCGKEYGNRVITSTREWFPNSEPVPPYRGNGYVVRESVQYGKEGAGTVHPEDHSKTTHSRLGCDPSVRIGSMVYRDIWDGESIHTPNKPFCTQSCAADFGHKAYKAGYRIKS